MKLGEQILPFFLNRSDVRRIRSRVTTWQKKADLGASIDPTWHQYRQLEESALKESLRSELSRRELMQRRSQSFLGTIAVMSAFTIGALSLFRLPRYVIPDWVIAVGVIAVLAFLAGGAWSALQIVAPDQLYDLYLQNRMDHGTPIQGSAWTDVIIDAIQLNQAHNLIFSIYSLRSYRCIRNGLVSLVLSLLLLLIDVGAQKYMGASL